MAVLALFSRRWSLIFVPGGMKSIRFFDEGVKQAPCDCSRCIARPFWAWTACQN